MTEEIKKEAGHLRRNWFFYVLLMAALGSATYFWIGKSTALKKQAEAFEQEKTILMADAKQALNINDLEHLRMMMKTFVWAVRSEMTRDNLEQVDQYFTQLVKVERIKEITLADTKGKILISTNKKKEDNQLVGDYVDTVLKSEEVSVIEKEDRKIVSAPVMSLDSRLGSLIIVYQPS